MKNTYLTNYLSQIFGRFANHPFSPKIQRFINQTYVNMMGLDMREFQSPDCYSTLCELFTRPLNKARDFNQQEQIVISPCDSFITSIGTLEENTALQIKGMPYSIHELFGPNISPERYFDGGFINLYLSPKDYHRYHAPCNMKIERIAYIPGGLYPVNFRALKSIDKLFTKNERVIVEATNSYGKRLILVFVGAFNVGQMVFHHELRITTNATHGYAYYTYPQGIQVNKGEELGMFKMGSTILTFFEPQTFAPHVHELSSIRYGQTIGSWI